MGFYHMLFAFVYSFVCAWACYRIALRNKRDAFVAGVLGAFFGVIAVIGYAIIGKKYKRDDWN